MFDPELNERPRSVSTTLRLVRVYSKLAGIFASEAPLYIGSHWRNGRSWPCVKKLLGHCPWCKGTPRREHAYLGVIITAAPDQKYRAVIELPPDTVHTALTISGAAEPFRHGFTAERPRPKAPLRLKVDSDLVPGWETLRPTDAFEMLRTIARVYALPDPAEATARETWLLNLRLRIEDPEYSPAVRQPMEE